MDKFCDSLTRFSRRPTDEVRIGAVGVGGDNPIRLQSMTNTDTNDTEASVAQVERIAAAGGEIVRLTAQGRREAANLGRIRALLDNRGCRVPLVADIHFLPAAALVAAEQVEKVRINPGNWNERGGEFDELLSTCRRRGVALRIGVNHGSLSPSIMERYGDTVEGMVASAMEYLRRCREASFGQVVVSIKSSNVRVMVQAYRMLVAAMRREGMRYPLHLGVTEAGTPEMGVLKSAIGIGGLLCMGVGDTLRVSLTADPVEEVIAAKRILQAAGIRRSGPDLISCPTCGRTKYDMIPIAREVERRLHGCDKPITVAVMGCVVNGPGEASGADVGIAGGKGEGLLFAKGKILRKVPQEQLVDALFEEIDKL